MKEIINVLIQFFRINKQMQNLIQDYLRCNCCKAALREITLLYYIYILQKLNICNLWQNLVNCVYCKISCKQWFLNAVNKYWYIFCFRIEVGEFLDVLTVGLEDPPLQGWGGYFSGVYSPRASASCTRRTSVYALIDNHNQIWGLGVKTSGSLGPLLCPRWFLGLFCSVGGSRRALRLSFRTAFGSGCLLLTSRRQSGKTQDCMSNIKTHKCTTQSELRQSYLPFCIFCSVVKRIVKRKLIILSSYLAEYSVLIVCLLILRQQASKQ